MENERKGRTIKKKKKKIERQKEAGKANNFKNKNQKGRKELISPNVLLLFFYLQSDLSRQKSINLLGLLKALHVKLVSIYFIFKHTAS